MQFCVFPFSLAIGMPLGLPELGHGLFFCFFFFCGRVVTLPSFSQPCLILDPKVQPGLIRAERILGRLTSVERGLDLPELPCGPMNAGWEGRARNRRFHSLSDFCHLQMTWAHGVSALISCLPLLQSLLWSPSTLHCALSPGPWRKWSWGLALTSSSAVWAWSR